MKDRFAARFSAAVLAIGAYCLYSPYHCIIHAGYADEAAQIEDAAVPMAAADSGVFCMDADTQRTEDIRGLPGPASRRWATRKPWLQEGPGYAWIPALPGTTKRRGWSTPPARMSITGTLGTAWTMRGFLAGMCACCL